MAVDGPHAAEAATGPRADSCQRFSAWTAVAKELPVGPLLLNLLGGLAFIVAVVPFHEIRLACRDRPEPRQFAGAPGALERTGVNLGEGQTLQPLPQPPRVVLAALRQRQIRQPGMLSRQTPGRFAVPGQVEQGQSVAHEYAPLRWMPLSMSLQHGEVGSLHSTSAPAGGSTRESRKKAPLTFPICGTFAGRERSIQIA